MKWKEAENANEIQQKAKSKTKTKTKDLWPTFLDEWKVAEKKENKTKKVKIKIKIAVLSFYKFLCYLNNK